MKKTTLLMLLSLLALLSADPVERASNSIAQDMGPLQGSSTYRLIIDGNLQTLVDVDGVVQKVTTSASLIETTDKLGKVVSRQYFESGRLVKEEWGRYGYLYVYAEDGKLDKVITLFDNKMTQMELYSYVRSTGQLAAILAISENASNVRYFGKSDHGQWFSYSEGPFVQRFDEVSNGVSLIQTWNGDTQLESWKSAFLENGNLLVTKTQGTSITEEEYDTHGLLVLAKTPSVLTKYQYNEGELLEEQITQQDGKYRINHFEGGRVSMSELYDEHSVLTKHIIFNDDNSRIETLYSDGKPYCDITFASDGKRVASITYR